MTRMNKRTQRGAGIPYTPTELESFRNVGMSKRDIQLLQDIKTNTRLSNIDASQMIALYETDHDDFLDNMRNYAESGYTDNEADTDDDDDDNDDDDDDDDDLQGGNGKKVPVKYLPKRLTRRDRKSQRKMLLSSRKGYKNKKYLTRKKVKSFTSKTSKHVRNARRLYKVDKIVPSRELAKKTGCSIKSMRDIVRKGEGAYYSSGSRPNQTARSWGLARLASAITGGKTAAVDYKILQKGCKHTMRAYKLATKSKRKHGRGTRRVPKTKI